VQRGSLLPLPNTSIIILLGIHLHTTYNTGGSDRKEAGDGDGMGMGMGMGEVLQENVGSV
jgi:hypothetical protein